MRTHKQAIAKRYISLFLVLLLSTAVYAQFANNQYSSSYYNNNYNTYAGYDTNSYSNGYYNGYNTYNSNYYNDYNTGFNNVNGYGNTYAGQYYGTGYSTPFSSGYTGSYYGSGGGTYGNTQSGYYGNAYSNNYYGSTNTYQAYSPYTGTSFLQGAQTNYFPQQTLYAPGSQTCNGQSTDFLIQIPLGGCTPNVVRSDLLAEQNVPVFCKISAIQLNPLIDVSSIQSISFAGDTPEGVAGISYQPARQAIRNYNTLLQGPAVDDAGYVVITLARNTNESAIQKFIEGNVTARIRYNARNIFGVGNAQYYVEAGQQRVPFWNGLGYLAVQDITNGAARVEVYAEQGSTPYQTFTIGQGQVSPQIYIPGYPCTASMQVRLNQIVSPADTALLNIEGEEIWVREGSRFANNYCSVSKIDINADGGGSLYINCGGRQQELTLKGGGIELTTPSGSAQYVIGDSVQTPNGQKFLAYYGQDANGQDFIITTSKQLDNQELTYISTIYNNIQTTDSAELKSAIEATPQGQQTIGRLGQDYDFTYIGETNSNIQFTSQSIAQNNIDTYNIQYEVDQANSATQDIVNYYPTEEKYKGTYWGEETLYRQILLAQKSGFKQQQTKLIQQFKQTYPSSRLLNQIIQIDKSSQRYDYSQAQTTVQLNNEYLGITLEQIKPRQDTDESATIKIGGRSAEFIHRGQVISLPEGELTVDDIRINGILLRYSPDGEGQAESRFIGLQTFGTIGGREIEVRSINTQKVAYLSVIPNIRNTFSEADFTFKIGVEQRNIKLNPEKARETAQELNQTIKEWQEVLDNLGNVIKVWKAACFATSTILMLQTMLTGFNGDSLARTKVMSQYKTVCDIEIAKGTYQTRTQCYNALSGQINTDVDQYKTAITNVNQQLKNVQQGNTVQGQLLENPVIANQTKYVEDLKNNLNWQGETINGIEINTQDLSKSTELSSIMLYQQLGCNVNEQICLENPGENVACCSAYKEMTATLKSAAITKQTIQQGQQSSQTIQQLTGSTTKVPTIQTLTTLGTQTVRWNGETKADYPNLPSQIPNNAKIQYVNINAKTYVLQLQDSSLGGNMGVLSAFELTSNNQWEQVENLQATGIANYVFTQTTQNTCIGNNIKNPQVRYYESGRNQGLPAVVPFDIENGWYAYVPDSIGGVFSGTPQSYTQAADVNFFWICNAGTNGVIEQRTGDDLCQSFSANQPGYSSFLSCGIEGGQVGQLYAQARDAIRQAAQSYGRSGYRTINGQTIQAGEPLSDTGATECQDFMSPEDCALLFNTCDPVICPSSRCDLGGKYPVADVVQTGIVGSIALCLPNAREGIVFPVCLTGIHAGLDAFVSILRSEQQCLEENANSGQYIGICDEITAVYMCELFWRNFGSVLDVIIPTFFEYSFGGPVTRGGGEYASVQYAWENLGKSMDFFTGFYAQNAIQSFQLRNAQSVGTEVCNGFIGTSFPTSLDANGIDALLSPQSPTQFYAYFSEVPFSQATSPAISQYKVYYHIYAGNNFGASYQVYLRTPTQTGFFASSPVANVKTGFIAAGQSADQSVDFTAPAGYKELCVRINGQENCGFGSVTTDFGLNYLSEKYTQDQVLQENIITEGECLSTSSSLYALAAPNIQAGAEKAIGGQDINFAGITRVCATQSPEASIAQEQGTITCETNAQCQAGYTCQKVQGSQIGNCINTNGQPQLKQESRWVDVGYCGDPTLRCWLDTATIKDKFNAIDAVNSEIYGQPTTVEDQIRYGQLFDQVQQDYQEVRASLSNQYTAIQALTPSQLTQGDTNSQISQIIAELDTVIGIQEGVGQGTANNKAEALALKATIYRMIAEQKIKNNPQLRVQGNIQAQIDTSQETQTTEIPIETSQIGSKSVQLVNSNGNEYISSNQPIKYYITKSNIIVREDQQGKKDIIGHVVNNKVIINNNGDRFLNEEISGYQLSQYQDAKRIEGQLVLV